jgi:hypothetical protein
VETGAETLAQARARPQAVDPRDCAPGGRVWAFQAAYNRMVSLCLDGVQGRVEDD